MKKVSNKAKRRNTKKSNAGSKPKCYVEGSKGRIRPRFR